ncbi:galactokinase [Gordonibacter urolithinfaciens]|uniref:galactokinase n=1 Tax=Gordonibacter urolithinfaciens TaxID=1335613 RepID=UPI000FF70F9B|nr:galactokinase family protein [Gordonibacter urolithinfaciens]ROT89866.1 galactokinase [Gordonibacter urolithinfaciens]GKG90354.1 galactokinase [Gordonibacter pamelaeae]
MRTEEEALECLKGRFADRFGVMAGRALAFASAPGRVELAGNHTDHQGGRTISTAIDRRMFALAAPNGEDVIHVSMEGFGEAAIDVEDLEPRAEERGSSAALVRGMAAAYARAGGALRGFDAVTCSDIPAGCGVSSSAAFEMLTGLLIRALCDPEGLDPRRSLVRLALDGSWAEDVHFGKPTGAQDQLASAFGGIVALDFAGAEPRVSPVAFDVRASGHALFLVDSRCDHSRYTDEFVAVPADMFAVAKRFGRERLEDVPCEAFLEDLAGVRAELGDRAALRALHYFEETRRVAAQRRALEKGDFPAFLALVRQSGMSSAQFLQNVSPRADASGAEQPAMVALALCAHLLGERGAYRIHGGGFGGSVLAFVPDAEAEAFRARMDALLGFEACLPVAVGAPGACARRIG